MGTHRWSRSRSRGPGPWCEREINARLFEAVLGYSTTRGPVRLLLATLAAVADEAGAVDDLATDELQSAAGMADSTYRRARTALLADGAVTLERAGGGRARTNQWTVHDPRAGTAGPLALLAPGAPSHRARPLLRPCANRSSMTSRGSLGPRRSGRKGSGIERGIGPKPRSGSDGFSPKGSGIERGFRAKPRSGSDGFLRNPAKTPPETPPPNARAGREPGTQQPTPPAPLTGGATRARSRSSRTTSPTEVANESAPASST